MQQPSCDMIKDIRKRTGLSQSQFAAYFGIPTRTLQNWEVGHREPPAYILPMMNRILDNEFFEKVS